MAIKILPLFVFVFWGIFAGAVKLHYSRSGRPLGHGPSAALLLLPAIPLIAAAGCSSQAPSVNSEPAETKPTTVRVLVLDGTPYERGVTHGRAMKENIHALAHRWKTELASEFKVDPDPFIQRFVRETQF